jgi:arylformamidase
VTRRIAPGIAVWPGDTPFSYEILASRRSGSSVNLTTLHLSAHTGTHADAAWHFDDDGPHPAEMPLEKYIGPTHVQSIKRTSGGITPAEVAGLDFSRVKRILFHSPVSSLADDQWPDPFPYLSVPLIDALANQGVVLIGLDSPSVDAQDSKDLPCHHRLRACGIVNLESLALREVPDGVYELIALPLRLAEVCGSPVRAILRSLL